VNVSITVSPIKNDAGQVTGISAITRDITERKCADEALQESNRQLRDALGELKTAQEQVVRQERLSALGTMASGIAHDFNNSLTAILGGSELLLQRPEYLGDKETVRSYIEMMNIAAQDAGKVVNRLREFYRHREDHEFFVPVSINELVGQTIALTQPKWKAEAEVQGVSVDVHTDLQEIPPIAGSAAELREALTNLILNAVDAMPRGGTIAIHTCRDDGYVVLEIGDTGTGMSQEVRRHCLEPFFTTKGVRGTGLGLSMVYGIIQRHRGTIDIETELGKGTTFIIRLPVQTAQPQSAPLATPASVAQPLHVLVIDDEAVVRKIVGEYLKIDGHIVEAANSGHDGLERFRNSRFDLVLVDRAMPGMSGDQVAATIKSANPAVPVIMLTGFGSMMDADDEKPAGVDLVLGKPVTINALRTALSKVVVSVN
jgi:signal transduction histidine kinase/CheY-like chemotaxis protein